MAKKEWISPKLQELRSEFTYGGNGHGNGDKPANCWCGIKDLGGTEHEHDHGSKKHEKPNPNGNNTCSCCIGNADHGWVPGQS